MAWEPPASASTGAAALVLMPIVRRACVGVNLLCLHGPAWRRSVRAAQASCVHMSIECSGYLVRARALLSGLRGVVGVQGHLLFRCVIRVP